MTYVVPANVSSKFLVFFYNTIIDLKTFLNKNSTIAIALAALLLVAVIPFQNARAELPSGADVTTGSYPSGGDIHVVEVSNPGAQTIEFPDPDAMVQSVFSTVTSYVSGAVLYFDSDGVTYSRSISPNSNTLITFSQPLGISSMWMTIQDRGYSNDAVHAGYFYADEEEEQPQVEESVLPDGTDVSTGQDHPEDIYSMELSNSGPQTASYPDPDSNIIGIWASVTTYVSGAVLHFEVDGQEYYHPIAPNSNTLLEFEDELAVSDVKITVENRGYSNDAANLGYFYPDNNPPLPPVESDTTAPIITVPNDLTVEASNSDGARVSFEVSALDDVDGVVPVTCDHNSDDIFPIGETTVTCTTHDNANNYSEETFKISVLVSVVDEPSTEPVIPPPPTGFPDLTPIKLFISNPDGAVGKKVDIVCQLMNQGDKNAGSFVVEFYVDEARVKTMDVDRVPLNSPDLVQANGAWVKSGGTHIFKCIVDAGNTVSEGIEDNNILLEIMTFEGPTNVPTATILDVTVSPTQITAGKATSLTVSGKLTTTSGVGISGKSIEISLYTSSRIVTSSSDGAFQSIFSTKIPDSANWVIEARFTGDSSYVESIGTAPLSVISDIVVSPPPEIPPQTTVKKLENIRCYEAYEIRADDGIYHAFQCKDDAMDFTFENRFAREIFVITDFDYKILPTSEQARYFELSREMYVAWHLGDAGTLKSEAEYYAKAAFLASSAEIASAIAALASTAAGQVASGTVTGGASTVTVGPSLLAGYLAEAAIRSADPSTVMKSAAIGMLYDSSADFDLASKSSIAIGSKWQDFIKNTSTIIDEDAIRTIYEKTKIGKIRGYTSIIVLNDVYSKGVEPVIQKSLLKFCSGATGGRCDAAGMAVSFLRAADTAYKLDSKYWTAEQQYESEEASFKVASGEWQKFLLQEKPSFKKEATVTTPPSPPSPVPTPSPIDESPKKSPVPVELKSANLSIDSGSSQLSIDLSDVRPDNTSVNIKLVNTGDYGVTQIQNELSGPASSWVKQKPGDLKVEAHGSVTGTFMINSPDGTKPGTYLLTIKFKGKDINGGSSLNAQTDVKIKVLERPEWSIENQQVCTAIFVPFTDWVIWKFCDVGGKDVKIGETFFVKADVRNKGNVPLKSIMGTLTSRDGGFNIRQNSLTVSDMNDASGLKTMEWTLKADKAANGLLNIKVTSNLGVKLLDLHVKAK